MYDEFKSLKVKIKDKVATVIIDHPPINLFDGRLIREMDAVGRALSQDSEVIVVVVESADPDFFIAHADVELIMRGAATPPDGDPPESFFQKMTDRFRTMPKITIGKVNGIARGGGLELLAAFDMRFCAIENARFSQPEVGLGLVPGGGGTAYWPELIGRSRAIELLVACEDFDAMLAERYGIVNRAVPEAQLDDLVSRIAARIAEFPNEAVVELKSLVQSASELRRPLADERRAFFRLASSAEAKSAMEDFLDRGGQSRAYEIQDLFG